MIIVAAVVLLAGAVGLAVLARAMNEAYGTSNPLVVRDLRAYDSQLDAVLGEAWKMSVDLSGPEGKLPYFREQAAASARALATHRSLPSPEGRFAAHWSLLARELEAQERAHRLVAESAVAAPPIGGGACLPASARASADAAYAAYVDAMTASAVEFERATGTEPSDSNVAARQMMQRAAPIPTCAG